MPDPTTVFILGCILVVSYAVESCLGFGSNVIALAVGLFFIPLHTILPVLVVIGILQSFWNMLRSHDKIQWRMILQNILPLALPGLAIGILLRDHGNQLVLCGSLGVFILFLSAFELKILNSSSKGARPLPNSSAIAFLLTGGIFQGLFASGGPAIVYYASRKIKNPAEFRSTLATLWQILNIPLFFSFWTAGQIGISTMKLSGILLPSFFIGAFSGTILNLNEKNFKKATWLMLFFMGFAQVLKTAFLLFKEHTGVL